MTQTNILELAKQGDAKAIAALINRQLQPKGITAKAALKDSCLQIMLESAQVPDQQALVAWVRKSIAGLGATSIERVKIYGRQTGEEFPAWSQEFELAGQQLPSPNLNAAQSVTSHKSQTSIPKVKPDKVKNSLPAQNTNSTARNKTTLKEPASENKSIIWMRVTFLLSILLLFINWVLALISFVIFLYFFVKTSGAREAAAKKIRQEQERLKQELERLEQERKRLEQEHERSKQELERLKQEQKQKSYLILLDPVNSPVKNLQTNLAQTALEEFRKVEARVNVGVSNNDLPAVLTPAKYVVQQFERSNDYHVSLALSGLITEIMSHYELSQMCLTKKAHRFTASGLTIVEQPGILTSDVLGKRIQQEFPKEFPNLQDYSSYYRFDMAIQLIWAKASECTNKLQQILDVIPQ